MIAKYRKAEFPGEWWLTDFTMEQVEGRLSNLSARVAELEAENKRLRNERDQLWKDRQEAIEAYNRLAF